MTETPNSSPTDSEKPPRGWLSAPVLAAGALSVASGYAAFSATALAGDVADVFGAPGPGEDLAAQIGLSATTLGVGLAIIRLASGLSLPAAAVADRLGRRTVLLWSAGLGLAFVALSGLAPGFWWWVALVALARPWLSATNTVAAVVAAEETSSRDRSSAVAVVIAAYALGAGIVSIGRGALGDPSFRLVSGLALVPLLLLPVIARWIRDPAIYRAVSRQRSAEGWRRWHPGAVPREHLGRLLAFCVVTGAVALGTGPGFTYLFVYGEQVLGASSGRMGLLVLAAGPVGAIGLLAGRWAADHLGRRWPSAAAMVLTGVGVAITYQGSFTLLAIGYLGAIAASAAFGPPSGALLAEAFPTAIRATAAAWAQLAGVVGAVAGLAGFGVLADVFGSFEIAVVGIAGVVMVASSLFAALPETRGLELDEVLR